MPGLSSRTAIRALTVADLPILLTLSTAAGWNQTAADWRLLLRLEPDGCLGLEQDGKLVATSTLICYQDELAWLGMVLTHPDYRRRGLARQLVGALLELAGARRIKSVKLDATDLGQPLYETLGFRTEQSIERWSAACPIAQTITDDLKPAPLAMLPFALDQRAFGASRARALQELAEHHTLYVGEDGYAIARPGAQAAYLGPCVAESIETARQLVNSCLRQHPRSPWFWDVLPANRAAVTLAQEFGFTMARRLVRMVKGHDGRGVDSLIFAPAGLEIG